MIFVIIGVLSFIAINGCDTENGEEPVLEWSSTIGDPLIFDSLSRILQTSDGGYLAFGNRTSAFGKMPTPAVNENFILKCDENGNETWRLSTSACDIKETGDGNYLMVRYVGRYFLTLTDTSGNMISDAPVDTSLLIGQDFSSTQYHLTADNGCIAINIDDSVWPERLWLTKFDISGGVVFSMFHEIDMGYPIVPFANADDGGFVICRNDYSNDQFTSSILKFDTSGDLSWTKHLDEISHVGSLTKTCAINQIIPLSDGTYLAKGDITMPQSLFPEGHYGYFVKKISADGTALWHEDFSSRTKFPGDACMIETADNDYVICGHQRVYNMLSGNSNLFLWLITLDTDGNVLMEKTYNDEEYDKGRAICPTNDGGFTLSGTEADDIVIRKFID